MQASHRIAEVGLGGRWQQRRWCDYGRGGMATLPAETAERGRWIGKAPPPPFSFLPWAVDYSSEGKKQSSKTLATRYSRIAVGFDESS
ncbi:hypothetical protein GW17_00019799 [Ensete ventricosum]|nr:hypothetical protein GW17_00019799 [Ensete ventricosum]